MAAGRRHRLPDRPGLGRARPGRRVHGHRPAARRRREAGQPAAPTCGAAATAGLERLRERRGPPPRRPAAAGAAGRPGHAAARLHDPVRVRPAGHAAADAERQSGPQGAAGAGHQPAGARLAVRRAARRGRGRRGGDLGGGARRGPGRSLRRLLRPGRPLAAQHQDRGPAQGRVRGGDPAAPDLQRADGRRAQRGATAGQRPGWRGGQDRRAACHAECLVGRPGGPGPRHGRPAGSCWRACCAPRASSARPGRWCHGARIPARPCR